MSDEELVILDDEPSSNNNDEGVTKPCICPVCQKKFTKEDITHHVNLCLDQIGSDDDVDRSSSSSQGNKLPINFESTRSATTPIHKKSGIKSPSDGPPSKRRQLDLKSWKSSPSSTQVTKSSNINNSTSEGSTAVTINNTITASSAASSSAPSSSIQENRNQSQKMSMPLAARMRPVSLNDFIGQGHILGKNSILRSLIESSNIPSMIFWGPPGCGKTSLANLIGKTTSTRMKFVTLSAAQCGVNSVKEIVSVAKNDKVLLKRATILFLDEIHRFNKLQQDIFLPCVEDGTITLIGATTENPSFSLNTALLSRCRVFAFNKLETNDLESVLHRAIEKLDVLLIDDDDDDDAEKNAYLRPNISENSSISVEKSALTTLANLCDGDARTALNCLDMVFKSANPSASITAKEIKEGLQRSHFLYDRKGEEHYNIISALHKSLRGSDADASLYWLGRMLEGGENPLYIARRLVRFSSEDVGLADPNALVQAVSTYQGCQFIGMPECEVILAQCVIYLARAPKSIQVYQAYSKVKECVKNHQGELPGVPLHLRNAPTKLMKDLGCGKGYKYNPAFEMEIEQEYMPNSLKHIKFL